MKQEREKYPNAEIFWVQEEHKNQGCWTYIQPRFLTTLSGSWEVRYVYFAMDVVCSHILYLSPPHTFLCHFIANLFVILEKDKKKLFYLKKENQLFVTQSIMISCSRFAYLWVFMLDTMMHSKKNNKFVSIFECSDQMKCVASSHKPLIKKNKLDVW